VGIFWKSLCPIFFKNCLILALLMYCLGLICEKGGVLVTQPLFLWGDLHMPNRGGSACISEQLKISSWRHGIRLASSACSYTHSSFGLCDNLPCQLRGASAADQLRPHMSTLTFNTWQQCAKKAHQSRLEKHMWTSLLTWWASWSVISLMCWWAYNGHTPLMCTHMVTVSLSNSFESSLNVIVKGIKL